MIKINWHGWFYDRVIFGWYHYNVYVAEFDLIQPPRGGPRATAKKIWLTKWQWNWDHMQNWPNPSTAKHFIPWHRCFMRNGVLS